MNAGIIGSWAGVIRTWIETGRWNVFGTQSRSWTPAATAKMSISFDPKLMMFSLGSL